MCDPFDNEVDTAWRADFFRLIAATPHLDWLLLTKRIGNAAQMISETLAAIEAAQVETESLEKLTWPWPNVWIGATLVNQPEHDRDIDKLRALSALVRFISYEPALGALRLDDRPGVDWVIAGGESGSKARPMHPQWVRDLRDQCAAAGVPFLFKQWGEWADPDDIEAAGLAHHGWWEDDREDGGVPRHEWPGPVSAGVELKALRPASFRVGKRAAGRLLDGVEHSGFPVSPAGTRPIAHRPLRQGVSLS